MRWQEVHIDTNHHGLETVEAMLSGLEIDGISVEDEEEFQDFLENNHEYWDYVDEDLSRRMAGRSRVTFYLEAKEAGFAKLGEVRIALEALKQSRSDCGTLLMTLDDMEDADWENNWKQYYKPMEIGKRLLVIPKWETADPGQRVPLYLDPGLTFGTGAHATTRLCLTALEDLIKGGERVLDVGCGSGILSVAALPPGVPGIPCGGPASGSGVGCGSGHRRQVPGRRRRERRPERYPAGGYADLYRESSGGRNPVGKSRRRL